MTPTKGQATDGRQRRNRSQDVLEAAVRVFHKKGYASSSIQDIADEVGVLKGSLYHYIDSKEDLLISIFDNRTSSPSRSDGGDPVASRHPGRRAAARLRSLLVAVVHAEHRAGQHLRERVEAPDRQTAEDRGRDPRGLRAPAGEPDRRSEGGGRSDGPTST